MHKAVAERFWSKVDATGICWEWTAARTDQGYGNFWVGPFYVGAHRWAYQALVGPIPDGLELDHLCRNRACVNPDHLDPVTRAVNLNRGAKGTRRYCLAGHPMRGDNLYVSPKGIRICKTCRMLRAREFRARRRLVNYAQGRT